MTAWYNDNKPHKARWLRNLIALECIEAGVVDERSIRQLGPGDLEGYTHAHFFAGIGAWAHALDLADWPEDRPIWTGSCPCQSFSQAGRKRGARDARHLWPAWFALIRECRPSTLVGEQVASRLGRLWFRAVQADLESLGYAVAGADLCAAGVGAPHIRQRLFWVAYAGGGRDRAAECRQADSRRPSDGGQRSGSDGRLAYADAPGLGQFGSGLPEDGHPQPRCDADGRGEAGGLADANGGACRQRREDGTGGDPRGNADAWSGPGGGVGALDPWRDCDWLPCADGVWRPVEPGTFPLVDGTAFRLGSGSPFEGQRRAALICGYGDAIVPQLGARFLLAAEEAILQERIRRCAWCGEPIPPGKRKDAETCSTACRQKRWRFRVAPAPAGANGTPLRLGYADPPYPGLAQRYYQCAEVDHAELIARLMRDYPHGWALSTSRDALRGAFPDSGAPDGVLALCPPDVRVCVWVKPHRSVRSRWPHNDWEPLIVYGGRPRLEGVAPDLCDVLVWGGRQHSHPKALVGMKPAAFCEWMFRQLGAQAGDTLDDLFPGSGAVGRAWALYTSGPGSPDASDGAASDASHLEARRVPSRLQEAQASLRERLDAPARRDD